MGGSEGHDVEIDGASAASGAPDEFGTRLSGRVHVGWQRSGKPVAQLTWRVTTEDHVVAEAVAGKYGGEPAKVRPSSSEHEVLIRSDALNIVVPGREAVMHGMALAARGMVFHACEGSDVRGLQCGVCASTAGGRMDAAWEGRGARPRSRLRFGMADLPDLGLFEIVSSSWDFAESGWLWEHCSMTPVTAYGGGAAAGDGGVFHPVRHRGELPKACR